MRHTAPRRTRKEKNRAHLTLIAAIAISLTAEHFAHVFTGMADWLFVALSIWVEIEP